MTRLGGFLLLQGKILRQSRSLSYLKMGPVLASILLAGALTVYRIWTVVNPMSILAQVALGALLSWLTGSFAIAADAGAAALKLEQVKAGQKIHGFVTRVVYTDHEERPTGLKLEHVRTRMPVHLLRIDTVPQAALWIKTYPSDDRGEAHALEHLLVGKGTKGRALSLLADMRLGNVEASTSERYTWYSFYSGSGTDSFFELLGAMFEALFKPDFTDEEAAREVYHLGVERDPETGQLSPVEKGTVYNEILSNQGFYKYWYEMLKLLLGDDHPLTYRAGGTPEAMRQMSVSDIREFHRTYYAPGPEVGLVLVVDPRESLSRYLVQVSELLDRFALPKEGVPGRDAGELSGAVRSSVIVPQKDREIRVVNYPARSRSDEGRVLLGWAPKSLKHLEDRMLLELFLSAFARGSESLLYGSLVDRTTRKLDTGATQVSAATQESYDPSLPIITLFLGGITGDQISSDKLDKIRAHVMARLREVAAYPERSPELAAFNRKAAARLRAWKRSHRIWQASPPRFGVRRVEADWKELLENLDHEPGTRKSLALNPQWTRLEKLLAEKKNPWTRLVKLAGLTETPFVSASAPSPELAAALERQRKKRLDAKVEELKKSYQTAHTQKALENFKEEEEARTQRISQIASKIPAFSFAATPPSTFDDSAEYQRTTLSGVPAVITRFRGMAETGAGLAFDLSAVPNRLRFYLPLFPKLLRSSGVRENGKSTRYDELEEKLRNEIYRLEVEYSANPSAGRYELTLDASGSDSQEFARSLDYLAAIAKHADFSAANLPRLRDLVEAELASAENFTRAYEEDWIGSLSSSFRYQKNSLQLAIRCPPSRAHLLQRLKWRLHEPVEPGRLEDLTTYSRGLVKMLQQLSVEEAVAEIERLEVTGLRKEFIDYVRSQLKHLDEEELFAGLAALGAQVLEDLKTGPVQALADLSELRERILVRSKARAYLVADPSRVEKSEALLGKLILSLPERAQKESPGAQEESEPLPLVLSRIRARDPKFKAAPPYYIGYVHQDSENGNVILTARGPNFQATDRGALVTQLSSRILGGAGPHGLWMKTWEIGLAYNSGIGASLRSGLISYSADRSPNVRATLGFIDAQTRDLARYAERSLTEYALAQVFSFSRSDSGFWSRGEAIATDIAEGVEPKSVATFSKQLLALRNEPELGTTVLQDLDRTLQKLLPLRGSRAQKVDADFLLFAIAPERQLQDLESYLPGEKLRLIRASDFWWEP